MMSSNANEQSSRKIYTWFLLTLFTLTYTFSFVDRQVINLLVEPIKDDMDLTDVQISYLQGLIFVIPYVLLSIPIDGWLMFFPEFMSSLAAYWSGVWQQ